MSSPAPPTTASASSTPTSTSTAAINEAIALRRDQMGQMARFWEQKDEIKASLGEARSKLKQLQHELPPEVEIFRLLAGKAVAEDRMEDLWSRYQQQNTPGNYDFAAAERILQQLDLLRKYESEVGFWKRDRDAINRLLRRAEKMTYRITLYIKKKEKADSLGRPFNFTCKE
ncbi:unnamed protein product [Periconia digitata]|uniref:Uncharacterized protein n=1 Tax=Periconia digitata TaxID=1303443 RepID=A0A9W4UN25_9PLEO|nr:unnamed protein product [Periconia digitata]